ncbi:MAG TPA: small ribosomal subunit Rsm22 family protein [Bryobacteraceae bacterium]|nr:small ribosomal subunit Rsm22 family protein [Bryobacteraceae bacterium]
MPAAILRCIEERAESVRFPALKRAAAALSEAYRNGRVASRLDVPQEDLVTAYLVTRMPATYAAASVVLRELRLRLGATRVTSLLDIGAGTGAATLAARESFPGVDQITLIERDPSFIEAARVWLPEAAVRVEDFSGVREFPEHDLVVAAYALGELAEEAAITTALRLWTAARVALVIIEPGTPRGFAFVKNLRSRLLDAGARMVAPCPAETPCPMADPDWCHFAARVERSSLHRRLKDAELGYEDEKFSYLAVAKAVVELPPARILRRPQHHPGWITLETCQGEALTSVRVTRRDRELFRAARHVAWGDEWKS